MAITPQSPFGRFIHRRIRNRMRAAAQGAPDAPLATLRAQRKHAKRLLAPLHALRRTAGMRLNLPRSATNCEYSTTVHMQKSRYANNVTPMNRTSRPLDYALRSSTLQAATCHSSSKSHPRPAKDCAKGTCYNSAP